MSIQVANQDLSTAVVGTKGTIQLGAIPPPTIGDQMRPHAAQYAVLYIMNESACGLTCTFPVTGETFTVAAGAWKEIAVPANETQLNYQVIYLLTGPIVSRLLADLYLPGEHRDSIGVLGNSPVGANLSTAQQLVNDGQPPGQNIIEATPNDGVPRWGDNNDGSGFRKIQSDLALPTVRRIWQFLSGNGAGTKAQLSIGDPVDPFIMTYYGQVDQLRVGTPPSYVSTIDFNGVLDLKGRVSTVKAQATDVNSLGVGALVTTPRGTAVTVTTQQTIATVTPASDGLYRIGGYARVANGTNGNNVSFGCTYTDAESGTAETVWFSSQNGAGSFFMNGSNSIGNGPFSVPAYTLDAKAGNAINIVYRDPTNTPNDKVSAWIERLT